MPKCQACGKKGLFLKISNGLCSDCELSSRQRVSIIVSNLINGISSNRLIFSMEVILQTQQASVSMLQRRIDPNYTISLALINELERNGLIGPSNGVHPRKILVSRDEWETIKSQMEGNWRFVKCNTHSTSPAPNNIDYELSAIDCMEGLAFEHWCAKLLTDLGYTNVEVTQGSGDHGVDVLAQKDGLRYAIQCKCYSSDLGNSPVQEVATGKLIYNCHVGAVMTNRYFTSGAKVAADATLVLLWDRDWIKNAISERNSKASPKK